MRPSVLLTLLCAVLVSGNTDFRSQAAAVRAAAAPLSGNGNYAFTSVQTGASLQFMREPARGMRGSVTNLRPVRGGRGAIAVQVENKQLRLSGLNDKCGSAQWVIDGQGKHDGGLVSYACVVGQGTSGTQGLHHDKQWWFAVPTGSRRSSHGGSYYLIALDHLSNLPARAVGAAEKDTYGGYRSTTLDVWSKGNKGQMWKITKK